MFAYHDAAGHFPEDLLIVVGDESLGFRQTEVVGIAPHGPIVGTLDPKRLCNVTNHRLLQYRLHRSPLRRRRRVDGDIIIQILASGCARGGEGVVGSVDSSVEGVFSMVDARSGAV